VADFALASPSRVAMTPETIMLWMSATKPTAPSQSANCGSGLIELDDPCPHVPNSPRTGKTGCTLRHVLTHTAGIRWIEPAGRSSFDEVVAKVCAMRIERDWIPRKAAIALRELVRAAEIVRRLSGAITPPTSVKKSSPLGMPDCGRHAPEVYHGYGERLGIMQKTETDRLLILVSIPRRPAPILGPRKRPRADAPAPRSYRMLLARGTLDGNRILSPQTVKRSSRDIVRFVRSYLQTRPGFRPGLVPQTPTNTASTPSVRLRPPCLSPTFATAACNRAARLPIPRTTSSSPSFSTHAGKRSRPTDSCVLATLYEELELLAETRSRADCVYPSQGGRDSCRAAIRVARLAGPPPPGCGLNLT